MPTRNGQAVSIYDDVKFDEQDDYWLNPREYESREYDQPREWDQKSEQVSDYGHPRTRPTYWSGDGEVGGTLATDGGLRCRKEKRLRNLEEDRTHPSSPHYGYDTPGSDRTRGRLQQAPLVRLVLTNFESRPSYVTEKLVRERAGYLKNQVEVPSNYGGFRLLVVVALLDTWGLSNEDAFQHEQFRRELKQEFETEEANVSSDGALFRKICELRSEVESRE